MLNIKNDILVKTVKGLVGGKTAKRKKKKKKGKTKLSAENALMLKQLKSQVRSLKKTGRKRRR